MRLILLALCMLGAVGVFAAILSATWRSHRIAAPSKSSDRSVATELMWAAIPCLMIVAAATPAVIGVARSNVGDLPAPYASPLSTCGALTNCPVRMPCPIPPR